MKKNLIKSMIIMLLVGMVFQFSCKPDNSDTEPPTISILSPTSDYSYLSENPTITISGIASDDNAIESVKWKDSHGHSGTALGTETWEIRDAALQNGDNVFTITAYDEADKSTSTEIMITYNQYLTFIGTPSINPNSVFVNVSTNVTVNVTILANPNLDEDNVYLIEVDKNGNELSEICQLYDDGNLNHGDEIKGDGVFSNKTNFYKETAGDVYLRVKANTTEPEGTVVAHSAICRFYVVENMDNSTIQMVFSSQDAGDDKYRTLSATLPKDEAIEQTISFMNSQANVTSAVTTSSNDIFITYSSGLKGMILTGDDQYQGGAAAIAGDRGNKSRIPLSRQTRGTYDETRTINSNPNILLNKNVLLYAPSYDQFTGWGTEFEDDLYETLSGSECNQFSINYLKNGEADLAALQTLSSYGLIVINTHGGLTADGNVILMTGETADADSPYLIDWFMDRLLLVNKSKWAVTPEFISGYNNNLPNSIVYIGACHSGDNNTMSTAFLSKGAQTYFGFTNSVKSSFNKTMANQLFPKIIIDNKTTGNAFTTGQHDSSNPAAYFVMFGNANLKYQFGFVNGDFEEGSLDGFITIGDGRVITQLSYITPYAGNFMGIISTGLGYTTEQGSISQSFCLPNNNTNLTLSFRWNFLSEEFLEYVGSVYQDYFKVLIIDEYGDEHTLFSKSIDEIANGYELTPVSPEIVFDQGDVYGTGWLDLSLDLSAFAGQHITLMFAASDIGDSIYDTAILLDNITIE